MKNVKKSYYCRFDGKPIQEGKYPSIGNIFGEDYVYFPAREINEKTTKPC